MKLYIDTSDREKITIGIDDERKVFDAKQEKSQKLLPAIVEMLSEKNMTIEDITEIQVEEGPGSFTGLRVGVSVANTIAWDKDIPINGKKIEKNGPVIPKYS